MLKFIFIQGIAFLQFYIAAMGNADAKAFTIALDPGHGGLEKGATAEGIREADIALDIALRTQKMLEDAGFGVVITRGTDQTLSLKERSEKANQEDVDAFLSIHVNSAESDSLFGIETYSVDFATDSYSAMVARKENLGVDVAKDVMPLMNPSTKLLSMELSSLVQSTLVTELQSLYGVDQIKDLGHKTAMFSVLVTTKMPAILIEVGFLSNPEERKHLQTAHYREAVAIAITAAMIEWRDRNQ